MREIKLDEFLHFKFLSDVELSPNGEIAAFVVHQCDEEENAYTSNIWVHDGACAKKLTGMGKEKSFIFEDDDTILFPAIRKEAHSKAREDGEELTAYYRIPISGGEASYAFDVPLNVSAIALLDAGKYLLYAEFDNQRPSLDGIAGQERAAALKKIKKEKDVQVIDEIPFWYNGRGFINKKRNRLYLYDSATQNLAAITPPLYEVELFALDRENKRLAYSGVEYTGRYVPLAGISLYDYDEGSTTELLPPMRFAVSEIAFMQGKLVFAGSDGEAYGASENHSFYAIDLQTKSLSLLAAYDRSLGSSVGSDCRYGGGKSLRAEGGLVYFTTTDGFSAHLCRLSCDGTIEQLTSQAGSVDAFAVKGGKVMIIALRGRRLQELYRLEEGGSETGLTAFNDLALSGLYLAQPQNLSFCNRDGIEIDGWALLPKDYDPGRKYPAILVIHGGPKTVFGEVYFHDMQFWANRGYFVLYSNPRGGDGKGNAFADIRGKFGREDYRDIMAFCDRALEQYPAIDAARFGVTGGSYGGYMTNWIIGHTDRFKAAVSERSVSNWETMELTSDIGDYFVPDQMAGSGLGKPGGLSPYSPLYDAENCTTPTLLIHAEEDYRCWMVEALQLFAVLQSKGVPTRMCLFKGENHELSRSGRPALRVRRLEEITAWFDRYLRPELS